MIHPKIVPPKIWNLEQKINDSKPHIWILSFNFRFSSTKSQNQQKLAKKITHFTNLTIRFCSKNLTHFTNLNALNIAKIILPQHSQQPESLYQCCRKKKHFSGSCQKKHFHCTISGCPKTTFSKHLESKCLYIPVYFHKKIFVQEM